MPTHLEPACWSTDILLIHDETEDASTGEPGEVQVSYQEIPQLITDLRRAYNAHKEQPHDPDQLLLVTKTGKVLTDSDLADLADEAERGYDPSTIRPHKRTT